MKQGTDENGKGLPMKEVVFVTPNLANGGAERVTAALAGALAQGGDRRVWLAFMKDGACAYTLHRGVQVRALFSQGGGRLSRIAGKIWRLRRMMKQHPDAAFVAMLPYETLYTHLAGIGLKNKKVYSLRNDPASMKTRLDGVIWKYIYPRADRIVFQTRQAMDFFADRVRKKGVVIANPLHEALPPVHSGARRREIVSVARLSPQKNFPLLLRAYARVYARHPEWRLRIYGEGPLAGELKALCGTLRIGEAVEFCGFADDVAHRIRQSGLFVLASDYEGISNAMLEALAMGLPCVCTDCPVGGARMFIQDGVNGFLTPVGDEERLAQAMLRAIEQPLPPEVLAQQAEKLRDALSLDRIAKEWKEVL